jgi:hypothetical protein
MLALLMGGGLILFGVGTGVSGGGLLNAFGGGGSSQKSQVSSVERQAQAAVKANPSSATDWGKLLETQWESATSTGFDATTHTFTRFGKSELRKVGQSWLRYQQLAKKPDAGVAVVSAEAYTALSNFSGAAGAWEASAGSSPSVRAFDCLALASYAAGDTAKGDLATAKLVGLLPKAQRTSQAAQLKLDRTSHTSALQGLLNNCEA